MCTVSERDESEINYFEPTSFQFFSDFAHFTDSSMGVLATIDRITGNLLWKLSLGSPIVALYK